MDKNLAVFCLAVVGVAGICYVYKKQVDLKQEAFKSLGILSQAIIVTEQNKVHA